MGAKSSEGYKMKSNYFVNISLVAFAATVLGFLSNWILGLPTDLIVFISEFMASVLVIVVLALYVSNSTLSGQKLFFAVFIIYCVIGNLNIHIEAFIFNVTDRGDTLNASFSGILITFILAYLMVFLFKKSSVEIPNTNFKERSVFGWVLRILLGSFIYFVIYAIAGSILVAVYPELLEFYKDKIPPFHLIIPVQFVRGFMFVGIAILILRTTNLPLLKKSVLIGLVFSIFGGIAPLIPPNEFMPAYVRLGHGFEVGISNFIYGVILGYLLGQKSESK
jgi:hypothetical protein